MLNAGEVRATRTLTSDGLEVDFVTNHLSGFLLAGLLAPARTVVVSSSSHARVPALDLDALATGANFHPMHTYSATKLCNVLFVAEFARRHTGATANAADPEFVRTDLGRHMTGGFGLFLKLTRPFQAIPAKAAATPVYLATSPEVATTSGGYFVKCRPGKPSALSQDAALARRLWDRSVALLVERGVAAEAELAC